MVTPLSLPVAPPALPRFGGGGAEAEPRHGGGLPGGERSGLPYPQTASLAGDAGANSSPGEAMQGAAVSNLLLP